MTTDNRTASKGSGGPPLFWHCDSCGHHEPAQPEYEHGDCEPCIHCDGTARVRTLQESAAVEQAHALGRQVDESEPAPPTDAQIYASEAWLSLEDAYTTKDAELASCEVALAESRAEVERLRVWQDDLRKVGVMGLLDEVTALRDRVRVLEALVEEACCAIGDMSAMPADEYIAGLRRRALATTQEPPAKEEQ